MLRVESFHVEKMERKTPEYLELEFEVFYSWENEDEYKDLQIKKEGAVSKGAVSTFDVLFHVLDQKKRTIPAKLLGLQRRRRGTLTYIRVYPLGFVEIVGIWTYSLHGII